MPKIGTRGSALIIRNARPPFQVVMRFPQDLLRGGAAASKERNDSGKIRRKGARMSYATRVIDQDAAPLKHDAAQPVTLDVDRHPEAAA